MGRQIILIGGGDYRKNENKEIDSYVFSQAPKNPKITVIPFAVKDIKKRQSRLNALVNVFDDYGDYEIYMLDENSQSEDEMKQLISDSDIIFITGGDPILLIDEIEKLDLSNSLKDFDRILVGYSAGAMILSNKIVIPRGMDKRYEESQIIEKGLGFLGDSIIPHYSNIFEEEIYQLSKSGKIYGIENTSAIIITKNSKKEIGIVHEFNH